MTDTATHESAGRTDRPARFPAALLPAAALAFALAGAAAALAGQPAPAAEPERPTRRVTNCFEGNCHAKQRRFPFLHGPTAIGACGPCHVYVDEKKHTFRLKREEPDLCAFCHVGKQAGKVVHKPIADGQCLVCHNPHGGSNRDLLQAKTTGQLCGECHRDVTRGRKYAHGPVASGNCTACHNAHASEHRHLLIGEGRAFCIGCHKEMGQQLQKMTFTHQPAQVECLQCHNSHASGHKMQLKEDPLPLCLSCHPQVKQQAVDAAFKHSVVITGEACLNCHASHGSDMARLMKGDTIKSCLGCHDKPVVTSDAQVIPSVKEVADPKLVKHGPIRDGNCSGCHNLHGGPVSRLLSKPYPETFYQPYATEKYALCFTCHDKELALLEKTKGLTRFRNGEVNLHYLHVTKPRQGRSCRACHSTHASKHPVHIRETVPFGQWQMPINFTPTKTGGSCTPGCHRQAAYDRVTPVPPPDRGPAPAKPDAKPNKKPSEPTPPGKAAEPTAPPTRAVPARPSKKKVSPSVPTGQPAGPETTATRPPTPPTKEKPKP